MTALHFSQPPKKKLDPKSSKAVAKEKRKREEAERLAREEGTCFVDEKYY